MIWYRGQNRRVDGIVLERRYVFFLVLLSLTILVVYSLFQVRKVVPNPVLEVEREIFTPAANMINVTGRGLAVVNLKYSSFMNPFLNYTDVTSFADDPDIISSRFVRSFGKLPHNIEYLLFRTVVNNTARSLQINYTLELAHDYVIKDESTFVLYGYTNLNGTGVCLIGENYEGSVSNVTFILSEAYREYYLYLKNIPKTLKIVNKINVTHNCQPVGFYSGETVFRILNIFDNKPSINFEELVEGQWWVRIDDIEFPHRFRWNQLKALNTTMNLRLFLVPDFNTSLNMMNYIWNVPDVLNVSISQASLIVSLSHSVEAHLDQARIILEENGAPTLLDVKDQIIEALSSSSTNPRLVVSIPNYGRNGKVVIRYRYWSSVWLGVMVFSLIAISAGIVVARRYEWV